MGVLPGKRIREVTDLLAISLDGACRAHLARALEEHRRWCRSNGRTLPPALVQLVAVLSCGDTKGQSGTNQLLEDDIVDTEPVPIALTYDEAGRLLGVSAKTVRRLVAAGELRAISVGSSPRIHREDLSEYAEKLRNRAKTGVSA